MSEPTSKAVLLYLPALHRGFVDFLKKHQDPEAELVIIDAGIVTCFPEELEHLNRDIRALEWTHELEPYISTISRWKNIQYIGNQVFQHALDPLIHANELVIADDEVARTVFEKLVVEQRRELGKSEPAFDGSIFLRWGKNTVPKAFEVTPDISVDESALTALFMLNTESEAAKSTDWWRRVGAAIVQEGTLVSLAHNRHPLTQHASNTDGDARSNFGPGEHIDLCQTIHAEAAAIAEAAKNGVSLEGAIMFVTTFPCPTCAYLIAMAGIKRLYFREGYSLMNVSKEVLQQPPYNVQLIWVKPNKNT